jgi:nuclear-control-of-ATPase protein 2
LDKEDMAYDSQGGVEAVRSKLCHVMLMDREKTTKDNNMLFHLLEVTRVSYRFRAPRTEFVHDVSKHLVLIEKGSLSQDAIFETSYMVAQVRCIDALLRVARDRLLKTCSKLKRLVRHWKRRVQVLGPLTARLFGQRYIQDQRDRLTLAMGAYRDEMERLGKVLKVLNRRPLDMEDDALIEALALSKSSDSVGEQKSFLSRFAIRWNDGQGLLTFRYFDQNTTISTEAARSVLSKDPEWIKSALDWTQEAQNALYSVLLDSVRKDMVDKHLKEQVAHINNWCNTQSPTKEQWDSVIELVDRLSEHQRIGEGTVLSLRDPKVTRFLGSLDIFGIPSSLVMIGLARITHEVLLPKWPMFRDWMRNMFDIMWTIIFKRVWKPFQDILMNLSSKKDKSLLEVFDVDNEISSLDNMLRDLGYGDGSADSRQEALHLASRRYEKDLADGVFRSAVRGHLVRLLLVQVQQLKAGLLHALDSIDALVVANRLNVQLLAAIPAVLIVTIGTRLLLGSVYTWRIKSIRSVRDVHYEMSDYLDEMEKLLLLTDMHGDLELGEFVLCMHSYLVLLDYTAPLFPTRTLDNIQKFMQDLFAVHNSQGAASVDTDRQVQLLRLIKEKHAGLLKHIL